MDNDIESVEAADLTYAVKVGGRLRAIRRQKRLSLQDVEAGSDQEFKASVLGAYERGEHAISVPRLQRLARFYAVPVDQLLPREDDELGVDTIIDLDAGTVLNARPGDDQPVTLDLNRLGDLHDTAGELLARYLGMIQVQRGDFNGRMLTIRRDDLRAIACLLDTVPDAARSKLDEMGLRLVPDAVPDFGAYLHVPFCLRRCDYSAFATWDDRGHLLQRYVDGLATEVRRAAPDLAPATSVFFGGGTPSLLTPEQLGAVLRELPMAPDAEVTVECNPDTVDEEKLAGYRAVGVNRISLGVQAMVPHVLEALGRSHDPDNVRRAVEAIRAGGFPSWNMDLIYGAVGESVADWDETLAAAIALDPPHVSAYGLTVEAGTPLASQPDRHPDDDDQATKYERTETAFVAVGLDNYEVSNWARPGHECRHNRLYWSQGDYRGFGCAAHSHAGGRRWWNVRTPERYLSLVEADEPVEAAGETLDDDERAIEGLQLALRMREGVPAGALDAEELDGLVERSGDRLVLTLRGRLLANEVALRLRQPTTVDAP